MPKKNKPSRPDKTASSAVTSPVTAAVQATLPIVYSAQIAHMQQISGPVPSPDLLRQYEELSPGLADRIVKMAEAEAEHRRKIEFEVVALQGSDQKSYRRSELAGQIFGLSIGLAAIIGAVIMAIHGAQVAASFLGTGGVTGLVTAFIIGRSFLLKQKQQDLEQLQKVTEQRAFELNQK